MANQDGQSDLHCWVPREYRHPKLLQETGKENGKVKEQRRVVKQGETLQETTNRSSKFV